MSPNFLQIAVQIVETGCMQSGKHIFATRLISQELTSISKALAHTSKAVTTTSKTLTNTSKALTSTSKA